MSCRYTVVFTTSAQLAPAASRTALRFAEDALRLLGEAPFHEATGLRVDRDLTRGEEQPVRDDALRVGTDRLRRVRRRDPPNAHGSSLKESDDLAIGLNGHTLRRRLLGKPRHGHDIPRLRDHEARTRRRIHIVDRHPEPGGPAELRCIVGE